VALDITLLSSVMFGTVWKFFPFFPPPSPFFFSMSTGESYFLLPWRSPHNNAGIIPCFPLSSVFRNEKKLFPPFSLTPQKPMARVPQSGSLSKRTPRWWFFLFDSTVDGVKTNALFLFLSLRRLRACEASSPFLDSAKREDVAASPRGFFKDYVRADPPLFLPQPLAVYSLLDT